MDTAPKITANRTAIPQETTVRTGRAIGVLSLTVNALDGWDTTTKAYFTVLPLNPDGTGNEARANHWSADVDTSARYPRFINMEFRGGHEDSGHLAGAKVEARVEGAWARDIGLLLDSKASAGSGARVDTAVFDPATNHISITYTDSAISPLSVDLSSLAAGKIARATLDPNSHVLTIERSGDDPDITVDLSSLVADDPAAILEGTAAPTAAQGNNGDLYIQKDNDNHTLELFIKASGAWGFVASVPQDGNLQTALRDIRGQLADVESAVATIPGTQTFNEMIADPSADARVYDASNLAEAVATRDTIDGDYHLVLREISNLALRRNVDIDSVRIYAVGSDLSTTELHREDWTILQDRRIIDFNISDAEKSGAAGKIQRADGRNFYHIRVAFFVGNAEADSRTATLWIVGNDRLKTPASGETGDTIKTKLEALAGNNRLHARAIQGLSTGGDETTESVLGLGLVNAYNGVYGRMTAGQESPSFGGYTYTGYSSATGSLAQIGSIEGTQAKDIIGVYTATVKTTQIQALAQITQGKTYVAVDPAVGVPLYLIVDGVAYAVSDVINTRYYEVQDIADQFFVDEAVHDVQIIFTDGTAWITKSPVANGGSADTPAQIRDKLAGLAGNARLGATAVKDLPVPVPSIYVSPSTFTKSAGARSIYVSLNSRYTNADNVHFNIGGISKNANYAGGRAVLKVDLTTTDVANLRNAPDPVIRVQANIRDSSNTELERLEVDILKVDPATGSGTAETAQQIIDKLFDPVVVDIAGANTSLAFDVGTAADVSGSARTYTGAITYTISAGQFAQGDTLTADYVVNNPVIQGSDPFDVEVRMLKSSDNSVIDAFNIGKSAGGQLTHILEEADTIKFQLNIKTPGRYAGTLVISNLQIQSSVPPAQPDVRKVMAKPLSDLEQRLQNDLTRSGSYSIDTISSGLSLSTSYAKMLFDRKLRSSGADISIDSDSLISLSPGQYKIEVHYIADKATGVFANNRANLKSRIVNTSNANAVLDEQTSLGYLRGSDTVTNEGVYVHHLIVSGNNAHKLRLDMALSQFEAGTTWQTGANGRITIYKTAGALRGEKGDKGDPGSGGLNQAAVDARVGALVQAPAKTGNNDRWPATKLPTTVPSTTNLQITNIWFGTQTQYDALPSSQKNNNNYLHYVQS